MIEWPLVVLGGLLGSGHCVGMCGAFAISLGVGARSLSQNIRRQLCYSLGRIFTYSFLGMSAGMAGFWFARKSGALITIQAGFCLVAGILLVGQGLLAAGIIPRIWRSSGGKGLSCLTSVWFASWLNAPGWARSFGVGVLNGFLPCGLVYAYLALAASSASLGSGLLTMLLFGIGTAPLMVITGAGASVLSVARRQSLLRIAAWCVLITGLISTGRGIAFLVAPTPESCPACTVRGLSAWATFLR